MPSDPTTVLRLGTRGSLLARTQSQIVANAIEKAHPGVHVELVTIRTSGDRITDRPLHDVGGKGLFTKEIEQALLAREIDFAVHSFKDVPVTMPLVNESELVVAAVPEREDVRDVLAAAGGATLNALAQGARVGTGSLRRRCQLLAQRPDLRIESIRGNIDTRLRKVRDGQFDAVVLAAAGLKRASLIDHSWMSMVDVELLLPAPGQGALALQCRREDEPTRRLLTALNDVDAAECVAAERALVAALDADCHSPIAALATVAAGKLRLQVAVGARDGGLPVVRNVAEATRGDVGGAVAAVLASGFADEARKLLYPDPGEMLTRSSTDN
jgi:hydroxymethylbilane synthase